MDLPPIAPIPPAAVRLEIAPTEWQACLDAWLVLTEMYLHLDNKHFAMVSGTEHSILPFISSFYREIASSSANDTSFSDDRARRLQRSCFLLAERMLMSDDVPKVLLSNEFLADLCHAYPRSAAAHRLLSNLWQRKSVDLEKDLKDLKTHLTQSLESGAFIVATQRLGRIAPLLRVSPETGAFFLAGSDFLDAMMNAYSRTVADVEKKALVSVAYLSLISLLRLNPPNVSAQSDNLYSLKAQADQTVGVPSLLADIVTNTPLLRRLRSMVSCRSAERLLKILDQLETYRMPSIGRVKKTVHRHTNKGKAPQTNSEMHIHRMVLVTQIHDLFPDLGLGFIFRLLDEYNDNVEEVTAHLLDDSLPQYLQLLDHTEEADGIDIDFQGAVEHLAPRSTPPPTDLYVPERRNVFDDDDLLTADASRLHLGKVERQNSGPANKAAILSALAAFDADDDERDDTYDIEDVGGTVDAAHPDGEPGILAKTTQEENEMALFRAYKASPDLFGRTFNVRKGQARMALKNETGMTDEAIEGWAIMLQREPKRLQTLESRLSAVAAFDGRQTELERTAYRESTGGTETEDSDGPASRGGRGGRGGRWRGRGGRTRGSGGSVNGPPGDGSVANAQRRKEANKGSRANHNRRDQRAKKMARGNFAG